MEWYFLISLALLPFVGQPDPAPGLLRDKSWSRNLECDRVGAETGSQRRPGQVITSGPRGDYVDRSAVICAERLMRPGLRSDRDEAILSTLDDRAAELAGLAEALRPDLAGRTWLVETYYPSGPVSAKISFAAKNALVGRGLRVSDRTPILGAGDVDVITRMPPQQAYPAACQRYHQTGSLGPDDALLAVVSRDPRETILHAGLCTQGQWRWLQ